MQVEAKSLSWDIVAVSSGVISWNDLAINKMAREISPMLDTIIT